MMFRYYNEYYNPVPVLNPDDKIFLNSLDTYITCPSIKFSYCYLRHYIVKKKVKLMLYYLKLLSILQRLNLVFYIVKLTAISEDYT